MIARSEPAPGVQGPEGQAAAGAPPGVSVATVLRAVVAALMVAVALVATGPPASAAMGNMNPDGTWTHRNISRTISNIVAQYVDSSAVVYVYDGNTTSGTAYCTVNGSGAPTCDGPNDDSTDPYFPLLKFGGATSSTPSDAWGVSATFTYRGTCSRSGGTMTTGWAANLANVSSCAIWHFYGGGGGGNETKIALVELDNGDIGFHHGDYSYNHCYWTSDASLFSAGNTYTMNIVYNGGSVHGHSGSCATSFSGIAYTGSGPGITVAHSGGSTSVSESGSTDTFDVVLDTQPSSDVVLSVGSSDTGEATVSPASLTFTNANWAAAQTVTVTGVNDDLLDGNQTATVTLSVVDASSDDDFDILSDETVTVAVGDNDQVSAVMLQSDGSTGTTESGGTDSFTVTLSIQPTAGDVVVAISSLDTGEVTVAPATLTFNSSNWNTGQTVTVTGVDDTTVDGTQNATITLSVVGGSSDTDVAVSVTNDDNDSSTVATTTTTTTTEPPVSPEPEVLLSAFAVNDDGFVTWVPSRTDGLQSYVLAWRPSSGSWTTHSSYTDPNALKDTLVGLADGVHSF
ncbi:MAG: hypothetical protein GY900_11160, partial [Actinomycetia bacterium]|nr:hypothetical protein [Actinomycetes bacterium]